MTWLLPMALATSAISAQAPKAGGPVSTSQIVLDGNGRKIALELTQVSGDWFTTSADAHVTLTLKSTKPAATLDLQLDGLRPTHTIDEEHNAFRGGAVERFFLLLAEDAQVNPEGDGVLITISRMDQHDIEARISGHVNAAGESYAIGGTLSVHRDALPPRIRTGTYGTCNNVVDIDKYYGAQSRSMSECELKFYGAAQAAIGAAFAKPLDVLQSTGWHAEGPWLEPADAIGRYSEKNLAGVFESIKFALDPAGTPYAGQVEALMESVRSGKATAEEFMRRMYDLAGATQLALTVQINRASSDIVTYGGSHRMLQVPGAAYAIAATRVAAPTGGGPDGARDATFVYVGKWSAPVVTRAADGPIIHVAGAIDKAAPILSAQNVVIRIDANEDVAASVVASIDFSKLQALLATAPR
jgi:hypothetical protein